MRIQKATKYNSFLKMGIAGPEGSGKSYSALSIATALSEKRVAVIDAELGSASKYADVFDFDKIELMLDENDEDVENPFTPERYIEAMKKFYATSLYDVLVIDGISPEWDDAGGILQLVDGLTRRNASSGEKAATRNAWAIATPRHKRFIQYILRIRMHVICTMRAKRETVAVKDEHGGAAAKKIVLDPIQREDVPYQFDVMGIIDRKVMTIDKTRCSALDEKQFVKPGKEFAEIIREWLKGDPMPERPEYLPEIAPQASQSGNGHANGKVPSQPLQHDSEAQSPAVLKMIAQAKARALAIGVDWEALKQEALGEQIADSQLMMAHFSKINGMLTTKEREKKIA